MLARLPARLLAVLALTCAIAGAGATASAEIYTSASVAASAPAASPLIVIIRNYLYTPAVLTIKAGTTVEWRNDDRTAHTATALKGAFDSRNLDYGVVYSFTFAKPGTYVYGCIYHPDMKGTIIVKDDASAAAAPKATAAATTSASATPGGGGY